jgi:photosystem II stability/assembly factor-like uncharacterized protein
MRSTLDIGGHRWRRALAASGLVLCAIALTWHAQHRSPATDAPEALADSAPEGLSGAFEALSFWGTSRAHPRRDIPPDAYTRGWEHSVANLRPPASPGGAIAGSTGAWTPLGPRNGGGRTLTIAFHPDDPQIVYAGAASGGLWRSTTGGAGAAAWERLETGLPELGVSTIAFEPGNPGVMYLGTGEVYNHQAAGELEATRSTRGSYGVGVLKSIDGGATWFKSLDWSYNQQHGVWMVRVDPANPGVVWAATTDGVYKSLDAGLNWSQVLPVVMASDVILHPLDPDVALAACGDLHSDGRGIYRTTDGGLVWSQVTGGGVPEDFGGKIQFGVTPADPDVVYASVGNGFSSQDAFTWLLRSGDFGATFELRSTTDYSQFQGWYAHDVAVHPLDPDLIICVGIDVWRSFDGGATLTKVTSWTDFFSGELPDGGPEGLPSYSHADHHDAVWHPTDPSILYLANDGGVFRSLDGGDTYEGVNGGYQTQQFYNGSYCSATDPDLAMGGLQDFASAIYRGDGVWARWVKVGDGGWCAIHPDDPDLVYATTQNLSIGRSTNGGQSFSNISPPNLGGPRAFISPFVMAPSNPAVLYGGTSFLFRSPDGGTHWQARNGGAAIDGQPLLVIAVAPQDENVLYLATAPITGRGGVYRSLDGGATVTDVTGDLPDRYPGDIAVDPTDPATVYLTWSGFGSPHVYKSNDAGDTWIDIDGGVLPDVPTTAVVLDPALPHHVYVGNDLGAYFTGDAGATWVQLHEGLPEAVLVKELNVSPANRMLRAFTHGQGLWERALLGAPCPGDFDQDGMVGSSDLSALVLAWGACPGCAEDLDGDGDVDVLDLVSLVLSWGSCP